jgi:hypothetical protein
LARPRMALLQWLLARSSGRGPLPLINNCEAASVGGLVPPIVTFGSQSTSLTGTNSGQRSRR